MIPLFDPLDPADAQQRQVSLAAVGRAMLRRGEATAALAPLGVAAAACPGDPALLLDLAVAQHLAGDLVGAMARYREVLALAPGDAGACNGLGALLLRQGDLSGAEALLRRALTLDPGMPEALNNLARLASWDLRLGEAIRLLDAALASRPNFSAARWTRAMARLQAGDMPGGWDDFEARWSLSEVGPRPTIPRPIWDGRPLTGRSLLLQPEQGLGDTLQFARYAPLLAARGGQVVLGVQPALKRLMRSLEGPGVTVVACGEVLPPIDYTLPLLSVPRVLRQGLGDIPAATPYLGAEPAAVARWRRRIGHGGKAGLAVGLVWAGNPRHSNDANRSLAPARLAPLAGIPGVRLFSLQCGPGRCVAPPLPGLVDIAENLEDFAETAAALTALDLLISVDTAPLHLAGALGRPAWALLPAVPDWRWLLGRADSPWYPSLRLFRQPKPGDWEAVVAEVVVALRRPGGA
ncbi:MAG: tetratricopeptide repeat protein [Acetobacteraceae bacterium]|nr:MAG: tetratricopeptide repeat protein [Acetobacteraceae bacterium]